MEQSKTGERVSRLGEYRGYSKEAYDGWQRSSRYVTVRDGTKLAVDIFRPTKDGKLDSQPLPVAWMPKRYQRATVVNGQLWTTAMDFPTSQKLVKHGYIVVAADMRGTGSSYGTRDEFSDPVDAWDGYVITQWLAAQPWSDGKIGMFGASYEGRLQLTTASTGPSYLKAIIPEVSPYDWYWVVYGGGIYWTFFEGFGRMVRGQDLNPNNAPVDEDKDGLMLAEALKQHQGNTYYATTPGGGLIYRNGWDRARGNAPWVERSGGDYKRGIEASGIAIYHRVGWFANMCLDQLSWYTNHDSNPRKILIGPWGAGGVGTSADYEIVTTPEGWSTIRWVKGAGASPEWQLWTTEALRFFDYWLKGIDNGIMAEPPIQYSTPSSHLRKGSEWRGAWQWPLPNEKRAEYCFDGGPSGSVKSVNDGLLTAGAPTVPSGRDDYKVDYGLSSGGLDPAEDPNGPPRDNSKFDEKALTYTTSPLASDVEVTGHPLVHLWVSSTAKDGDFFVLLEDVDQTGVSTYVTKNHLRASHRAVSAAPYNHFGMPWHRSFKEDLIDLPAGQPVELAIDLLPTSYIFRAGHRIRVTITGADGQTGGTVLDPAPTVSVYRNSRYVSSITLPIIPPGSA